MFSKKNEKLEPQAPVAPKPNPTPPQTAVRPAGPIKGGASMAPSVIGPELKITGHAVSQGEVQVDGEIEGDLECASLMVGESACITGNVIAEEVVVRGKVMGSIRGMRVTLQSSSQVEGDVYHHSLAIEQGAYFEGKSRRSENPTTEGKAPQAGAPAPQPAPSDVNGGAAMAASAKGADGKNASLPRSG